jgi:hypothetical protein
MERQRQNVRGRGSYTVRRIFRGVEVNHRGEILGDWAWYGRIKTNRGRTTEAVMLCGDLDSSSRWWPTDLRYVVTKERAMANLRSGAYTDKHDRLRDTCWACGWEGQYESEAGSWPRCPACQNC